ncbi:hypothetical protein DVH24_030221 [Malus domestica]|uniref:FANCL C-terminal domain-containing protein n=1 Tax=Malus domestica TaxID=3750 RepID=A0A498HXF9_MALDO|nr:hypothetical protein DVH24_030221 [Malus domestica]
MGEPGEVQWRSNISQLLDIHLETLQAFWSTLDDIDRSLWVVDPKQASPDVSYCQIIIENDCCIVLSINSVDPRTLPDSNVDDELRDKSGTGTDYAFDNTRCNKAFHSICLVDWLRSITTRRQSFDVLFGSCPYCSEPVAVKINSVKK